MQVALIAIGKLKAGPERLLVDDYLDRAGKLARRLGLAPPIELALEPRGGAPDAEAQALLAAIAPGDLVIGLDERGVSEPSHILAEQLAGWRDQARGRVVFVIGGADGLGEAVRARSDRLVAFGAQTWPHKLARVMAAEQIYRAFSILDGAPYHRA